MELLEIGDVVRKARKRHGLTQEDLAYGICAVSTLSRIENGQHNPQNRIFDALMERMGETAGRYMMFVGPLEMKKNIVQEELARAVRCGDCKSLERTLEDYGALPGERKLEDVQWIELATFVLHWCKGMLSERMEEDLLKLLYLTYPEYNGVWDELHNYSACEMLIFQLLTACYEREMKYSWCLQRLKEMLKAVNQKNMEEVWRKQAQISICYQIAALCLAMEEYPGSVRYGKDGLLLCRQMNSYQFAPMLLSVLATGMTKLGDTKKADQAEMYAGMVDKMLAVKNELQMFIEDII